MITLRCPPLDAEPLAKIRLWGMHANCNTTPWPFAFLTGDFWSEDDSVVTPSFWTEVAFRSELDSLLFSHSPVNKFGDNICFHSKVDGRVTWTPGGGNTLWTPYGNKSYALYPDYNLFRDVFARPICPTKSEVLPEWTAETYVNSFLRTTSAEAGERNCTPIFIDWGYNPVTNGAFALLPINTFGHSCISGLSLSGKVVMFSAHSLASFRYSDSVDAPVFTFSSYFYTGIGGCPSEEPWQSVHMGWSVRVYEPNSFNSPPRYWNYDVESQIWVEDLTNSANNWSKMGPEAFWLVPGFRSVFSSPTDALRFVEYDLALFAREFVASVADSFPSVFRHGPFWTSTQEISRTNCDPESLQRVISPQLGVLAKAADAYVGQGLWTLQQRESLGNDVLDGCQSFSGNLLAYVNDLRKMGDSVRALMKLAKSPRNPKSWASAWLALRYSDRLTWLDTKELILAIRNEIQSFEANRNNTYFVVRARTGNAVLSELPFFASQGHRQTFQKTYFVPKDLSKAMFLVRKLMEWDAWPTLENTWDLIPLSFVVDWFADLGGLLRGIDYGLYQLYVDVPSSVFTEKIIYTVDLPQLNARLVDFQVSEAEVVVYKRRHTDFFHWNPLGEGFRVPSNLNVIDGISLLIQ